MSESDIERINKNSMDRLTLKLREGFPCLEGGSDNTCRVRDAASGCLCATAADTITALRAEVERLEGVVADAVSWCDRHDKEPHWLDAARAALGGTHDGA